MAVGSEEHKIGSPEFSDRLRKIGEVATHFGNMCETLKRLHPWQIRWAIDLQIDETGLPWLPNTNLAGKKKFVRDNLKKYRKFRKSIVKFFANFPPLKLNPDLLSDEDGIAIFRVVMYCGSLGRSGFHVIILSAVIWEWLAAPTEATPNSASVAAQTNFYAARCAAAAYLLEIASFIAAELENSPLASKEVQPSPGFSMAVKKLSTYVKKGREASVTIRRQFRTAGQGTVSIDGIVAMNWHEAAFQLADRVLGRIRQIVDPQVQLPLLSPVSKAEEVLLSIDLSDKWQSVIPGLARIPEITDVQRIQLELQCELEVATGAISQTNSELVHAIRIPLNQKQLRALEFIKSLDAPIKGAALSHQLGIRVRTFRRHYAPALRQHGLKADRNGYFFDGGG